MVDGLFAYLLLAVHFFYNHHLCMQPLLATYAHTHAVLSAKC